MTSQFVFTSGDEAPRPASDALVGLAFSLILELQDMGTRRLSLNDARSSDGAALM